MLRDKEELKSVPDSVSEEEYSGTLLMSTLISAKALVVAQKRKFPRIESPGDRTRVRQLVLYLDRHSPPIKKGSDPVNAGLSGTKVV